MPEALKKADEVLQQGIQGITDLINLPALINLDFADVQTVMTDKGIAHIGIGEARGDDKAMEAVQQAVSSPLLETTIKGATHVIINVFPEIFLLWMPMMLQAMYRSLQVRMQTSSLVLCMMILLLIMQNHSYCYRSYMIITFRTLHLETELPILYSEDTSQQTGQHSQAGMKLNMPSFSLPTMNATQFGTKTPSSTVQKKDIQIPDFLRNR